MRHGVLVLIIIFFSGKSGAQYHFTSLQAQDGLSSNAIQTLMMDSDGFLWIGTFNGLNRFDGSSIKVYNWANNNYPLDHPESISDIAEVNPGHLLIGTTNGLLIFTSYEREFKKILVSPGILDESKPLKVYDMTTDPNQRTWILSSQGLFIYKQDTLYRPKQLFKSFPDSEPQYTLNGQLVLDTMREGLWACTGRGLCFIHFVSGVITTVESIDQVIPVFRDIPASSIAIHPGSGDIWWGDQQNVLLRYRARDQKVESFGAHFEKYGMPVARTLFVDTKARIWYSTWTGKCIVLDTMGVISILPSKDSEEDGVSSGYVSDIIEDVQGDIMLATLFGVGILHNSSVIDQIVRVPYDNAVINSLVRSDNEHLLISTNAGLMLYDEVQRQFEIYKPEPANQPASRVFITLRYGDEWLCGTSGIRIFNPLTLTFRQLELNPYSEEIRKHSVTVMIKDRKGNIWFTTWGGYVYSFDPVSGICTKFDGSNSEQGDIGQGNCMALIEDSRGRIWVGYKDKGMRVFDYTTGRFTKITQDDQFDESVINQFVESHDGYVWASTWGKGLFKLSLDGQVSEHITTQQGLTSNYTSSVSVDDIQRIWVSTPESVHYINPGITIVSEINYPFPFALGEDWPSLLVDANHIYVSLKDRLVLIDPTKLEELNAPDLPLISGISVFEKEFPYSPLSSELKLKHNQNFFTIEFSSPHHMEFPSLQYAYILEGFNSDWVNSGRRLSASFTNVPPGEYVFRVKNSDQDGTFHEDDRHFSVIIRPPFWKTNVFYILWAVIIMYLLFLLYRYLQRRKEKKKSDQIIDYFANSFYGENAVNEICMDIARNCISQLGFEDCAVYLVEPDRNVLTQRAAFGAWNLTENGAINPLEISIGHGILGTVAKDGQATIVQDTMKDERYIHGDKKSLSEITVPILHEQNVIGVIDSEHPRKNFFNEEHLKTLSTIASISSFKIADAQASMREREGALKLMEVNTLFAESQLKALRAQMNPHFVFNCLNSIQECIVMKKYGDASAYLNKFAKLFRLVLNNSGKLLITIDEEIEILTLYLELELMRFENSFQYTIHIDPRLETDDILMPSMFLQPFVENALWHGLMHKTGDRKLEISFDKISEEIFSCSIKDNGVGRKKSAELKKQKIFTHSYESKGMKMNVERLEVLRHQGFHALLQIVDMENPDGISLGTNVIVEFSNNLIYK